MIEIPVLSRTGEETSSIRLDEQKLGGRVHMKLLKQSVMMYQANLRQGTASSKMRSEAAGSNRKLYPQKHTGNARMGMNRTPSRRGGGKAFGPKPRDFGWQMPRKARQLATRSAILAKLKDGEVKVVETLAFDDIKTKRAVELLKTLKVEGSCLLVTAAHNKNLYLSARNLPGTSVAAAGDLNAYDILRHRWLVIEKQAVELMAGAAS